MPDYYDNIFQRALDENIDRLNASFQRAGNNHGWPQEILDGMSLHVSDGNLSIEYDGGAEEKIDDLEYGTLMDPARAAIRGFTREVDDELNDIFAAYGVEALFERGVF